MIHTEFMVWREGYLQAPSLTAPGNWRRFYRGWEGPPPFTREPPGLSPIPERPSRPLPAGGATAHGRRLRRQGLSGRRGRNQRDGERKLRWRSALQSARLSWCLVAGRSGLHTPRWLLLEPRIYPEARCWGPARSARRPQPR